MAVAVVLVLLALLLGGVGLAVEALRWLLIVGLILLMVGMVGGWHGRDRC